MDDGTILIYLIVRSIFDKREFKQEYVDGIEERKEKPDSFLKKFDEE